MLVAFRPGILVGGESADQMVFMISEMVGQEARLLGSLLFEFHQDSWKEEFFPIGRYGLLRCIIYKIPRTLVLKSRPAKT